ncbi:metal cation symporter ZIP8-like [Stigmatopora nigra]
MRHMAALIPLLLGALLQFGEGHARAPSTSMSPGASHEFLRDIVRFFGHNESITTGSLEELLHILAARRDSAVTEPGNPLHDRTCLSVEQILTRWGLANVSHLSMSHLETVCPAMLTQVLVPSCPYIAPSETSPLHYSVWAWGFLSVTLINLAALLGLLLIPFIHKSYFPKVLTYFIGLAVGTLFSNAVLQLVPEALGLDPKTDNYVHNAVGIFGGFYLLFLVERILTMALRIHQHDPPSHCISVDDPLSNGEKKDSRLVLTNVSSVSVAEGSSVSSQHTDNVNPDQVGQACCLTGRRLSSVKTVAWMITLSDAVHNFIDGLAIGASFTVSPLAGFSTSIAIVCEEFPHELGDFVILLNSGMSVPQAVFFNLLSAMTCYVGLVLGVLVGSNFAPNPIFAVAGGMFLYIALADMLPEMYAISQQQEGTRAKALFFLIQNAGLLSGFAVILLITVFAGDINFG